MLNLMGKGKESYDTICELCRRCSQGSFIKKPRIQDISRKSTKSANGGVTCMEISTLLDDFKVDILSTLSS